MMATAWTVSGVLAVLACAQQPAATAAQQRQKEPDYGVRLGQNGRLWMLVHPRLMYDDNVTLSRRRRKDTIFLIDPTLRLRVKDERFTLDARHTTTWWGYLRYPQFRRFEHLTQVSARADLGGPYFGINGGYQRTLQPVDTAFTNQIRLSTFNAGLLAGFLREPYKLELEPTWLWLRVANRPVRFFEYDHWLLTGRLGLKPTEPLWIILAGSVGATNFLASGKADNRIVEGRAGPDWTPMDELSLSARLGYRVQDYHGGRGARAFREDYRGIVYRVNLTWRPTDKTRWTLEHAREVAETVLFSNYTRRYRLRAAVSHRFHPKWVLTLIGTFDTGRESRSAAQRLKDRITGQFVLDHSFSSNAVAELSMLYRNKRTNDDLGEYDNWRVTGGVRIRF